MILGSCVNELKTWYPTADTSGFKRVYRLNDGKYPKIFNKESYPKELLEREVIHILDRIYYIDDHEDFESDMSDVEEEIHERLIRQRRISFISNVFIGILCFLVMLLVVKMIIMV